ncbi:MAG: aminotransferase class V-fold PLP-dependent enzyme [Acidobacteriota bacterium]|nr:aminotransferase class V-fold PLP-dependent enzyme [Acidobacteriota bacterium]
MNLPIYMDGHATTRVDPRVIQAMIPFFAEHYGNAASRHHRFGWVARDAVADARAAVAALIGAKTNELIFTSGALNRTIWRSREWPTPHELAAIISSPYGPSTGRFLTPARR